MPVLPRISFRLTPALQDAVAARVRQGQSASDVIREALEAYLGVRQTDRPTPMPASDTVSDMSDRLEALASDVATMRERLEALEAAVAAVRQRPTREAATP